jgi:hypothetical protein
MKKDEALRRIQEIKAKMGHDPEKAHGAADDLLCEILESLGYGEVVREFDDMARWYA